jgi:hypothetical protein
MLVDENRLRDVLREAIADVTNRDIRPVTVAEKQIKEMAIKMYNISGGEMAYVLNGMTPVDTMTDNFMFKVASVLYEYIKNNPSNFDVERLDVDKYFNDVEKREYRKKIDRKVVDKDIICDNWIQIADDQWVIKLSNKQIYELSAANKIHYNPETQRNLTIIETDNGQIKKVTIDGDAVGAISNDMVNGDYIPNTITLNINPDLYPRPKIVNNKFIISSESIIDCTNGYHRTKASVITTKLHPEVEFNFIVVISCFDVKKAKKYIIQENYKVPLSEEQITTDDPNNGANFIINKLKDSLYLKDANITSISYQLNRIITQIFNPERITTIDSIQKVLGLFKTIEKNINNLIENNNWIGKVFTKEEWFIYLYSINYCINSGKDFIEITNKININALLEEISITNEPIKQHYKIMNEVIRNV